MIMLWVLLASVEGDEIGNDDEEDEDEGIDVVGVDIDEEADSGEEDS